MSELQDGINIVPYVVTAIIAAPWFCIARGISKQNKAQYAEFQKMKGDFEAQSEPYGKDELVTLYKRLDEIHGHGFIIFGKKAKEIDAFWKEVKQQLQPHIRDEIRASLDSIVFDSDTHIRDMSPTYFETISPVRR